MDIQSIMQRSKEHLLKEGDHPPILYVDYGTHGDRIVLHGLPSEPDQANKTLFIIGRDWGEKDQSRNIAGLCFISEGLAARGKPGGPLPTRENAKRSLLIQVLDVVPVEGEPKPTLELSVHLIEQIRDNEGKLLDLIPDDKPHKASLPDRNVTPCHAFLAGFAASRMSEERQRQIIAKAKRATRKQRIRESWGS